MAPRVSLPHYRLLRSRKGVYNLAGVYESVLGITTTSTTVEISSSRSAPRDQLRANSRPGAAPGSLVEISSSRSTPRKPQPGGSPPGSSSRSAPRDQLVEGGVIIMGLVEGLSNYHWRLIKSYSKRSDDRPTLTNTIPGKPCHLLRGRCMRATCRHHQHEQRLLGMCMWLYVSHLHI